MQLQHFDIATFLRDYWQQKPLLIRNPWAAWRNPLEPDELAGLACEDGVEARLIAQAKKGWQVEHGPLAEARFGKMGKAPWTLLVNAVDHHVPDVAALIEPFRFVPNWRIDDVMVSYATDGGGVGPHFDQYDVFLVQGLGKRRWQIGAMCNADTPLQLHDDLRLIADFEPVEDWILEPGDILYVPPGVAHNGVAVGDDCMTYSIGFRAPSRSELIAHYCDDVLGRLEDDDRYADPGLAAQSVESGHNPGEISADALERLHDMVTQALGDRDAFARWFGEYSSTPKYPEQDWSPEAPVEIEDVRAMLAEGAALRRNPASRFSFIRHGDDRLLLFVDGECYECADETRAVAAPVCAQDLIEIEPELLKSDAVAALIAALMNQGSIALDEED